MLSSRKIVPSMLEPCVLLLACITCELTRRCSCRTIMLRRVRRVYLNCHAAACEACVF